MVLLFCFYNYLVGSQLFLQIMFFNEFGSQKKMVEKHCCTGITSDRRVASIWKKGGGGFFDRVRKLQTTLTRIFIVLEPESHGLSKNWDGIFGQARKLNPFFRPKTGDLQKKKGLHRNWDGFFTKIGNSNAFPGRITTSTSQLRHPISFGGSCFHFFTENRPQKHQKRAILHTLQANGGARAPPGFATD